MSIKNWTELLLKNLKKYSYALDVILLLASLRRGVISQGKRCYFCAKLSLTANLNSETLSVWYTVSTVRHIGRIWTKRILGKLKEQEGWLSPTERASVSAISLRHILASLGTPWDNRGKCHMKKRIQCLSNVSQHVPIYLQPFPSNSTRKFKSSPF